MRAAAEIQPEQHSIGVGNKHRADDGLRPAFSALIFFGLVVVYCAWILSLPVFPSQDGPAHVYYARVTRDLLLEHSTYASQFRIARPFPPYSVHAYVLMALRPFTSGEMAEKLLACLAVIVGGCGVFYLARQLGRSAIMACFTVPFLLNRYLFLGFYGYVLATGFALLSIAVWLRADRRKPARRVAFLVLTVVTLFSHPVPYLLLLAFCWGEVLLGWWNARRGPAETQTGHALQRPTLGDFAMIDAATALLLYVAHYSHSGPLWRYEWAANWDLKLLRIVDVFRGWIELPVRAPAYDWLIGATLVAITLAVLRQASQESKQGLITRTQAVVGFALLVLLALPLLPPTMNGSGFFADRFSIWPPLLLIASAASFELSRRAQRVLAVLGIAVPIVALFVLGGIVDPVARKLDVSAFPKDSLAGEHLLEASDTQPGHALTFDPYLLAPARLIDRGGGLLVGAPWLELQIMILDDIGPKAILNNKGEVQMLPGPKAAVGAVDVRCDANAPSTIHPPTGSPLTRFGCFDIWQPDSNATH